MDGFRSLICLGSKTLSSIDIVFEYTRFQTVMIYGLA